MKIDEIEALLFNAELQIIQAIKLLRRGKKERVHEQIRKAHQYLRRASEALGFRGEKYG